MVFRRLKAYCLNKFGITDNEPAPQPTVQAEKGNKTIAIINQLKQKLIKLTEGYNASAGRLQTSYNIKLHDYEKQYQLLQEAHKLHQNKAISDSDLKQAEQEVKLFQEDLHDAGAEIDKVKQYQKEDILEITSEIDALKGKYTDEMATRIKVASMKLKEQKEAYLNNIFSIGEGYRGVLDTEKVMKKYLQENGIKYDSELKKMLEIKTENLPILLDDLLVDAGLINDAMVGNTN